MKGDALTAEQTVGEKERDRKKSRGKEREREKEREIKKEERKKHDGAGKVTTSRFNDQTLALTPSFPPSSSLRFSHFFSPFFFFSSFFLEQTSSGIYTRATRGGKLARGQDSTCLHAPVLHRSSTNDRY